MTSDEEFLRLVARKLGGSLVATKQEKLRRVFLCGAGINRKGGGVRRRIGRMLDEKPSREQYFLRHELREQYSVHYPEELFDGLTSGPNSIDLLTLENELAEAVDVVMIVMESSGAIAELGAFANHGRIRKKLIVVLDESARTERDFVGRGPVRLIKNTGEGLVVYVNFERVEEYLVEIKSSLWRIVGDSVKIFNFSNIFNAPSLIVPSLFVFEVLTRQEVATILSEVSGLDGHKLQIVVSASLSLLLSDRIIARNQAGFRLTKEGVAEFGLRRRWYDAIVYREGVVDQIRVDVLSRQRRGLRSWADVR